ncbi:MAG: T9SS type A sorting domain-containing protein [Chitinophagaceae bacterium]
MKKNLLIWKKNILVLILVSKLLFFWMMKPLHNILKHSKKLSLLLFFIGLNWVVYADGGGNNFVQAKVVKCYPNPATSVINFDFPKNIDNSYLLQVYSFTGRKMAETSVSSAKITIDLTDFYRGIYVYQLHDKSGKIVESGKFQVVK